MPELPDVEVFAGHLKQKALRQPIQSIEIKPAKILKKITHAQLVKELKNSSFRSVKRVGKYLFLQYTKERYLVLHFGMTGFVYVFKGENPFANHTRALFSFKEKKLAYVSQRMLGFISITDSIEEYTKKLGPDALKISKSEFCELFSRGTLKSILMNQRKLSGIGNVYCDEILFQGRFSPNKQANSLSNEEIGHLYMSMKRVLKRAIEAKANRSHMPASWLIHARRKGEPCPRCKTPIRQIKSAERSTYYCPKCQR